MVTHLNLELKFRMSTTMPAPISLYCAHTDKFSYTFTFFSSVYMYAGNVYKCSRY